MTNLSWRDADILRKTEGQGEDRRRKALNLKFSVGFANDIHKLCKWGPKTVTALHPVEFNAGMATGKARIEFTPDRDELSCVSRHFSPETRRVLNTSESRASDSSWRPFDARLGFVLSDLPGIWGSHGPTSVLGFQNCAALKST